MRGTAAFVLAGLAVALGLAVIMSPLASDAPDGLERVARDHGFARAARPHAFKDSPVADYELEGVDRPAVATGLAGAAGVAVTFAAGVGLAALARARRKRAGDDGKRR